MATKDIVVKAADAVASLNLLHVADGISRSPSDLPDLLNLFQLFETAVIYDTVWYLKPEQETKSLSDDGSDEEDDLLHPSPFSELASALIAARVIRPLPVQKVLDSREGRYWQAAVLRFLGIAHSLGHDVTIDHLVEVFVGGITQAHVVQEIAEFWQRARYKSEVIRDCNLMQHENFRDMTQIAPLTRQLFAESMGMDYAGTVLEDAVINATTARHQEVLSKQMYRELTATFEVQIDELRSAGALQFRFSFLLLQV